MVATEKLRSQLTESYEKKQKLLDDISNLQVCLYIFPMHIRIRLNIISCKTIYRTYLCLQQQLRQDNEYLKAASRLSEQLEKKDEQIERLNEEGNYYQRLCTSGVACIVFPV